jgi:hypothetical protein
LISKAMGWVNVVSRNVSGNESIIDRACSSVFALCCQRLDHRR